MKEIILTLSQYRQLVKTIDRTRGLIGQSAGELKDFQNTKLADWEEDQIKFYLED